MPHVDLGAGLLQYADNRPTIITLVGMVAVGMVRVGMLSVGMVGVGMVPAPNPNTVRHMFLRTTYPYQLPLAKTTPYDEIIGLP